MINLISSFSIIAAFTIADLMEDTLRIKLFKGFKDDDIFQINQFTGKTINGTDVK